MSTDWKKLARMTQEERCDEYTSIDRLGGKEEFFAALRDADRRAGAIDALRNLVGPRDSVPTLWIEGRIADMEQERNSTKGGTT